nr:alpha-mannosidase [Propioniciclava coleopterorum]
MRAVDLCVFEAEVFELVHDVEVLAQLAQQLPPDSARRATILRALDRALDQVDLADVAGTAAAARAVLAPALASQAEASAHRLSAVGHAHIDSAWLWPLRETVRKVARTAASMTTLLEEDDAFVYAMSSAHQYAWLKQHRPEVFARVRDAVAAGRFVPIGGMWVEPDAVLPSGESFIRQISHGQRFFREEFGLESTGAWLPDSFGYSGALPQLLVGSGLRWFLTQKISWNQVNRFPHHTFWWEGIDGTRIYTHFPPLDTYNAELSGEEVARAARQFQEKSVARSSLAPTGWGDGGGGTTREMLARARRLADLEGSPQVVLESADAFFDRAMAELPDPEVWRGELYLELHRATFTTQHRTKQGNRRNQAQLAEAELWSATAAVRTGHPYPYDALDELWREVLLLQFHDILPGTSIAWVHREAEERHAAISARLADLIADALDALGVTAAAGGPLVINAAPVAQHGAPALAVTAGDLPEPPPVAAAAPGGHVLESGHVRVGIDADGFVVSLLDKASGRDAVPAGGRGNLLQLHQDFPNKWDAWDVDAHYLGMVQDLDGPAEVRADGDGVVVARTFGASRVEQRLSLARDGRTLLIDHAIDWHEDEKFLKLAFDVDVFTDEVVAETQFGHQRRAHHTNTSWEAARFETHAQRWFLVREPGFGVAFLNESSHGFDVRRTRHADSPGQIARFSLLRAPRYPDPTADRGRHTLRVGVLVGADVAAATAAGLAMEHPVRRASGSPVPPLVAVRGDGVLISAVKLADDRSGDLIVRAYESRGGRATARFALDAPREHLLADTNLIEVDAPGGPRLLVGGAFEAAFRPFQVRTFRLSRRARS